MTPEETCFWLYFWACYFFAFMLTPVVWACLSDEMRDEKNCPKLTVAIALVFAPLLPPILLFGGFVSAYNRLLNWSGGRLRPKPKWVRPADLSDEQWLAKLREWLAELESKQEQRRAEAEAKKAEAENGGRG